LDEAKIAHESISDHLSSPPESTLEPEKCLKSADERKEGDSSKLGSTEEQASFAS